jgi:signal transduction histidine kinase
MNSTKQNTEELIKTARSQLDKALENLEHLSGLDRHALGFAAHALGNYLTVIEGTVDLLRLSLRDYSDQQVHTWLNGLSHATSLMLHTTNQLMGSSAGSNPDLVFEEVDLPVLTERICQFYKHRANRKSVDIKTEFEVNHVCVKADRVALAAVFDNLLSNAVKYSEPEHRIMISITEGENELVWKICDEGPGVLDEEVKDLFKEGVKLSNMPTGNENSTGYGLAVAKFLITQMGGCIWYEPNQNNGSCFLVSMPFIR